MKNPMIGNIITALATAAILGIFGWLFGIFEAGSDALNEAQIEAVIKQVMVLDDGTTYAAMLNSIDKSVGEINVSIGYIQKDITRIDGAVQALASE